MPKTWQLILLVKMSISSFMLVLFAINFICLSCMLCTAWWAFLSQDSKLVSNNKGKCLLYRGPIWYIARTSPTSKTCFSLSPFLCVYSLQLNWIDETCFCEFMHIPYISLETFGFFWVSYCISTSIMRKVCHVAFFWLGLRLFCACGFTPEVIVIWWSIWKVLFYFVMLVF